MLFRVICCCLYKVIECHLVSSSVASCHLFSICVNFCHLIEGSLKVKRLYYEKLKRSVCQSDEREDQMCASA